MGGRDNSTDFSQLGPARALGDDKVAALKAASEAALVATWTNPAGRNTKSGFLRFSIHNQQIVGDKIYLSHYHGGVYVLDASEAFRGERIRPRELGFYLPHGPAKRPENATGLLDVPYDIPPDYPFIWDMFFYKGYVLTADLRGGFYSLQFDADAPPGSNVNVLSKRRVNAADTGALPATGVPGRRWAVAGLLGLALALGVAASRRSRRGS